MSANQDKHGHYVRNASSDSRRKTFTLAQSFACAWEGVVYAFTSQRNLKIQLCFAIAAVILGLVFGVSFAEWACIIVCIGVVCGLECVNTAIESVVDLVSPEWNELAKRAKDCAAGAVYLCSIASVIVACVIYIPHFLSLIG